MIKRAVALLAATGLLLAACGDDDDSSADETATGDATTEAPATTEAAATTEGAGDDRRRGRRPKARRRPRPPSRRSGGLPADADPEGVVRLGYDLAAASRGGFKWDPSTVTSPTTDMGIYQWVYGTLLRPNGEGELVPDLAESVEVPDPNTVEIVVREGLTLSDGTPMDAAMVAEILTGNLAKAENPAYRPGFYSAQGVTASGNTVTVTVPDGTAESWAELYLSQVETVMVPPGTNFEAPIGAGAFTVAEYAAGQTMRLEKNPEYWDADAIKVAGIELIAVPPDNPQAAAGAVSGGQVDWVRLNFAIIDAIGGEAEASIEANPQFLTQILICKSTAPLDNVQVRQALNQATDRDAINQAIFRGEGVVAWDLWPDGHPLHNPELDEFYPHDPAAAQALLAEAGAEGLTVDVIPIPAAGGPEIVQIMQQQWAEAGITLNIIQTTAFQEDFLANNLAPLGLVPQSGGNRAKLDNFSGPALGNVCQYSDPELEAMVAELATVSDSSEEGTQLWHDLEQIIVEDALSIPLLFQPTVYGINPGRLGNYDLVDYYTISVPDLWELYIKQ